jgi:uncharacterized membrane protein HdeD (DUF308 family)
MENLVPTAKKIQENVKHWWVLLLMGILFILMGFYVLANPVESYVALAMFFAAVMLISGIFQLFFSIFNREKIEGWGWQLTMGIMETLIGLVLFFNIGLTLAILPFYVGFWLMFRAFTLIGFSFEMKSHEVLNWGWYLTYGILLGIFSWFIIIHPVIGGITIIIWTGTAFIISGIVHTALSFKLKNMDKKLIK